MSEQTTETKVKWNDGEKGVAWGFLLAVFGAFFSWGPHVGLFVFGILLFAASMVEVAVKQWAKR